MRRDNRKPRQRAWQESWLGKRLSGPEEPLEPLAPSPYASVIYSAPRTRSKVGPKRPSVHRVDQSLRRFAGGTGDFRRSDLSSAVRGFRDPPGLRPSGPVHSLGDPGPSLRPWPHGTGAKGSKAPRLVSNPAKELLR